MEYRLRGIMASIKARVIYMQLFLSGNLSFLLVLLLALPAFLRPRTGVTKPFNLYGKTFIVPNGKKQDITLVNLIHQIIGHNQYRLELIKKNGVVIDAGANMGVFSVVVAARYLHATIYAFEPNPATFETLSENTKYYSNIKIFNCGLGEKEKIAPLILTGHFASCYITENYAGEGSVPVKVKTVDSFNLPVSFMKIDTEGYEANILKGG